jgi:hypothetical protein
MQTILARRMPDDGLVHYGLSVSDPFSPSLPPVEKITIQGPGQVPTGPGTTATPAKHAEWLDQCRKAGFTVKIEIVTSASP